MTDTIAAISRTLTQAPEVNFATSTTTSVTPVATAPRPLTSMFRTAPGPRFLHQWPTIPACESVNARNAPIAKSGISRSVTPPKTISRIAASAKSTTMPCE